MHLDTLFCFRKVLLFICIKCPLSNHNSSMNQQVDHLHPKKQKHANESSTTRIETYIESKIYLIHLHCSNASIPQSFYIFCFLYLFQLRVLNFQLSTPKKKRLKKNCYPFLVAPGKPKTCRSTGDKAVALALLLGFLDSWPSRPKNHQMWISCFSGKHQINWS